MARKRKVKQLNRSLRKTERVVVRNAKGHFKKFRSDLKLVVYVQNKKSGKIVGTLNQVEDGKPKAKRFSGAQFTLLSKPKVSPGFEIQIKGDSFRVYSKQPIVEQIPRALPIQVKRLAKASEFGTIILALELFYQSDFHIFTDGTVFDGTESTSNIRMVIAKKIIDALYNINVRISAKVHSPRPKNKISRYIDVVPLFS